MANKPGKSSKPATPNTTPELASDPAESRTDINSKVDISPKHAAGLNVPVPHSPTKPAPQTRQDQLQSHNPAQGTPSIRRNPEAGKPKAQRTNRGAKVPHDGTSPTTSKNPSKRDS